MAKAKRVTGTRVAPNLPKLSPSDFKDFMWEGVQKGLWTLHEASFYLNREAPKAEPIDPTASGAVPKMFAWLTDEHGQDRLKTHSGHIDPPLFKPGTIMRHLWERDRYFPLKVWALYDAADRGEVSKSLQSKIVTDNYKRAAKVIKTNAPNATKVEISTLLEKLPGLLKKANGLPYFLPRSQSYLQKIIAEPGSKKIGRPKAGNADSLTGKEEFLIGLIRKELR